MEKQKATHEIVSIGERSAHYVDRRKLRKKRGWFDEATPTIAPRSSPNHTAGWFNLTNAIDEMEEIFSCDIHVRRL